MSCSHLPARRAILQRIEGKKTRARENVRVCAQFFSGCTQFHATRSQCIYRQKIFEWMDDR